MSERPPETFRGQPIVRCGGCGCWLRDCQPLWQQQQKCCPDCDHPTTYPRDLDPRQLEPYYSKHVNDMTAEGLHNKSDIALQLAWRDQQIAELEARLAVKEPPVARQRAHDAAPASPPDAPTEEDPPT